MSISEDKRYVGEIGTEIIVDCGRNVVGAEIMEIHVKKPDGTTAIWPATPYASSKSSIRYITVADDFEQSGSYEIQARIKLAGWDGLGKTVQFEVFDKFA